MTPKVDLFCFEKYFELFVSLVEKESNMKFVSFPSNTYTEQEEGYKDKIYEEARQKLQLSTWNSNKIGTGEIMRKVISSLKVNNNNLVKHFTIIKFENLINDTNNLKKYEQVLFDFFRNLKKDDESFDILTKNFSKNYPLIGYFFFIKDKAQYMPISPEKFDNAFKKLGVINFETSRKCSWDNYLQYNKLLNEIRYLLIEKDIKDVSLLNAHSFTWIISHIEKKITIDSEKESAKNIKKYHTLKIKDKETIIRARNGQGIFRDRLIDYWNKCSITGCTKIGVLIASHIKPWSKCDIEEATDVYNGLLF